MINRNFFIHEHLVAVLALIWLMASPAAYAQPPQAAAPPAAAPTPEAIKLGHDLFDGRVRFANKGASCNACHHVQHDASVGGGSLSTDLTQSFSRMGKDGLNAIVGSAPFPAMQVAYAGKELAPDEIQALVAFLQQADRQSQNSTRQPADVGLKMFGAGAVGVAGLIGFFSLIGRRRKQQSVNQEIYDRQVKSE